ncbi:MAG: nitronate monooxygenase [Flavobacteriales bacterium]|nr:nitronate monooxygenase [Flavobacteriales bacterium]MBK7248339.1 nitronate monooxygenase [Flavobacteriales bacterium]MBK7286958.1 nitronate monooxygenase [Flavobacteriales bacterium]MBK9059462.1 nitronate monooxygenase [Flavobacteriales bacterium]MBK9598169.1 nitronate monooxygenase [Flavobacteriales bacterium]
MSNRVTSLFGVRYPLVQAGMIWNSGWRLAAAVSNAGGLGVIGSGSMYPDVLLEHVRKCKAATSLPFAVNIPMLYPDVDKHIHTVIEEGVPIVFTSAGNPGTWTRKLKDAGIIVVHVTASVKFARKAEDAGVDAVVAEGFEAGGHNGREETTTMVLVPMVRDAVQVPVIAAGGIGDGRAMLAAMALGADGVQMGSRFVCSEESSGHAAFKQYVLDSKEGDTLLTLKELAPVRMMRNPFFEEVRQAYARCATPEELKALLGRARAKRGMFEGDLEQGELEIGQVGATLKDVLPAATIVEKVMNEFKAAQQELASLHFG